MLKFDIEIVRITKHCLVYGRGLGYFECSLNNDESAYLFLDELFID